MSIYMLINILSTVMKTAVQWMSYLMKIFFTMIYMIFLLTSFHLMKGCVTSFKPKTNVASFVCVSWFLFAIFFLLFVIEKSVCSTFYCILLHLLNDFLVRIYLRDLCLILQIMYTFVAENSMSRINTDCF